MRAGVRGGGGGGPRLPDPPAAPPLPGHVGLPPVGRHRAAVGRRLLPTDTVPFPQEVYTNNRYNVVLIKPVIILRTLILLQV